MNLRGPFLIARLAVPVLPPGGSIVFIGSLAGLQPGSSLPAYDASKAGLIGLCRHVAQEGARRVVRAAAAVFLLSDEASYITGQTVTVDGGLSLI